MQPGALQVSELAPGYRQTPVLSPRVRDKALAEADLVVSGISPRTSRTTARRDGGVAI